MPFTTGHQINIGRPCSDETKIKISLAQKGEKSYWYGKHFSEESRMKLSNSSKGKILSEETRNRISTARIGMKFSEEHIKNLKESHKGIYSGNEHPGWRGGKTPYDRIVRHSDNYREWRTKVFERDKYTCQNVNCQFCNNKVGVKLHPHHIKSFSNYEELRFEVNNGVTYCIGYHLKGGIHKNSEVN